MSDNGSENPELWIRPPQAEIDEAYRQLAAEKREPVDAVTPYDEVSENGGTVTYEVPDEPEYEDVGPRPSKGARVRKVLGQVFTAPEKTLPGIMRAQLKDSRARRRAKKIQDRKNAPREPILYEDA